MINSVIRTPSQTDIDHSAQPPRFAPSWWNPHVDTWWKCLPDAACWPSSPGKQVDALTRCFFYYYFIFPFWCVLLSLFFCFGPPPPISDYFFGSWLVPLCQSSSSKFPSFYVLSANRVDLGFFVSKIFQFYSPPPLAPRTALAHHEGRRRFKKDSAAWRDYSEGPCPVPGYAKCGGGRGGCSWTKHESMGG